MNRRQRRQRQRERAWIQAASEVVGNTLLEITSEAANLELQAAAGDGEQRVRDFSMTAYTGGAMLVDRYHWPVVVDLAGMTVATQSRPILKQHDVEQIVGHTESIKVSAQRITLSGKISGVGEAAEEVVRTADNGFPWQSSIGASVEQLEFVDRGNTVNVNGKKFTGPVYVARKTSLKEVSFVALGGDDNSSARVAAEFNEGNTMGFDAWLKAKGFDAEQLTDGQRKALQAAFKAEQGEIEATAPSTATTATPPAAPAISAADVTAAATTAAREATDAIRAEQAAETRRINSIRRLCAAQPGQQIEIDGERVDLESHAIETADFTPERVELAILRASRPSGPGIHISDSGAPGNDVIEAALCRANRIRSETIEASYNDQTLSAADRHYRRGIGLQELVLQAAHANGYTGRGYRLHDGNLREVLRAAFSTADLSGILSNTQNKVLLESFNFVEQVWRAVSGIGQNNDFKQATRYRLIGDAKFEEVAADGKLKHGTLDEESFTAQVDTYGKIFSITRKMLRDDDMNALQQITRRIGRGAALKLNEVFWTVFLANSAFFTAARKNYHEGAGSALDSASLQTSETMFLEQTDHEGHPLGAMPAILLTPVSLGVTARELYESTNVTTGGASTKAKQPSTNIWQGKYRPEQSAYLNNATIPGGSALHHFLLADPLDLPVIETTFLDGVQVPTVESADADFDELGIAMRGFWDFGVSLQEFRGGVKAKGE